MEQTKLTKQDMLHICEDFLGEVAELRLYLEEEGHEDIESMVSKIILLDLPIAERAAYDDYDFKLLQIESISFHMNTPTL